MQNLYNENYRLFQILRIEEIDARYLPFINGLLFIPLCIVIYFSYIWVTKIITPDERQAIILYFGFVARNGRSPLQLKSHRLLS